MTTPISFTIDIPDATLDRIRQRVADYDWHEMPSDGGWGYGANLDYMRELCAYWVEAYDWRAHEAAMNAWPHFIAQINSLDIHFIHERGSGPNPVPLIISHGWPGSVWEFQQIIGPLAHPERHGGNAADAFDVIAPSLPGYGFSSKPDRPIGPRKTAAYFAALMNQVLGYDGYMAQGGDWGSVITSWLGFDHTPACQAIHLNMNGLRPGGARPETDAEVAWAKQSREIFSVEGGYFRMQSTKPQTLSYALMDSPVGIAAWIVEKFHGWSDIDGDDLQSVYSMDQLLTNVMIYLVTRSFNTSTWMYYGYTRESNALPAGERVEVPVGIAQFPKDLIFWPPRSYAEKAYNVTRWTEMRHGGHFAAMEKPDLLVNDIRDFARGLR